jgi:endonuclease/exonuclease/phosphatase family metal-dependent hydrolase
MKLLTWNVQWFLGLDGVVDVARVVDHARSLCDFDVLCLQEVSVHLGGLNGGGDFDQAAEVAKRLPDHEVIFTPCIDYRHPAHGPRQRFGNLVATRLPALLVENHLLPCIREADIPSARRVCTSVLLQAASGPLTVMNTHLEYHSAVQRALQVQRLLDIHRENADLACADWAAEPATGLYQGRPRSPRTVLCGDFNFGPGSSEHRSLTRGAGPHALRDVFTVLHGAAARPPTFGCYDKSYAAEPIACDHVFASADIAPLARCARVDGTTQLSDHQPVYVELERL